ncbi:MAG: hypothetical protein K0R19_3420 [Bacillota bacterium]|jgi:hypothetical protein|nr:hypothetical protein [Bacillota bacterium]
MTTKGDPSYGKETFKRKEGSLAAVIDASANTFLLVPVRRLFQSVVKLIS